MPLRPPRTKADLVQIVRELVPTRACARAALEGTVTVLGGFNPPKGFPSWIIRIESKRGTVWIVQLICHETARKLLCRYLAPAEIPWQDWIGEATGPYRPLIDGDERGHSELRRTEARRLPPCPNA